MGDEKNRVKVGIMTWWHNANYGGFLQGVALQTWLERHGVDAELIDFAYPRADFRWWRMFGFVGITRLRQVFTRPVLILQRLLVDGYVWQRIRRVRKTREMLERFAKKSPKRYGSMKEVGEDGRYGTVLAGSDQVWNTQWYEEGKKEEKVAPFLLEGLGEGVRKASYASSVGRASVGADAEVFGRNLSKFDAISVRERVNVEELERLSGKKVEWVADPTLLLGAEEWRELLGLGDGKAKPHICVYWLSLMRGRWRHFAELAKREGLPVHIYTEHWGMLSSGRIPRWLGHLWMRLCLTFNPRVKVRAGASAVEFLRDLSTADLVVSDSFHALMFSTIFGRKVRVVTPRERAGMKNRIEDFLELAGRKEVLASEEELEAGSIGVGGQPMAMGEALRAWVAKSGNFVIEAAG